MIEISWFGRGGQGAFTAARLLANAYVLKGGERYALAFPTFGPERRGAPVRAFSKLSESRIADRGEIERSDFAVFLDDSLFDAGAPPVLKEGGRVIVNTSKSYDGDTVVTIDAAGIAQRTLGLPIVNTVLIGAIAALSPALAPDEIDLSIERNMPERLWAGNKAAVRAALDAAGGAA
ncbi:MAG: 2-oxoacid:acceptor oxidoreductase family protein [Clostridiales Family XIII bacterium]|jgi:pyruvate ferredoxin oxidoreductase gamma subunit|nr:2-oxoacid:acceptor oxidoreductase family protein [Clostridiales Family XIII bacterium]